MQETSDIHLLELCLTGDRHRRHGQRLSPQFAPLPEESQELFQGSTDDFRRHRRFHPAHPEPALGSLAGFRDQERRRQLLHSVRRQRPHRSDLRRHSDQLVAQPGQASEELNLTVFVHPTFNARHLSLVWPIPNADDDNYPALLVAASRGVHRSTNRTFLQAQKMGPHMRSHCSSKKCA